MPKVTIAFGFILIFLATGFYVGTGSTSITAFIPAFFGLPMVITGVLAHRKRLLKHAMHFAAIIGLLGFLGGAGMGLPKLFKIIGGGEVARPAAVYEQVIMGLLCGVFVVLCICSFISARRAREDGDA